MESIFASAQRFQEDLGDDNLTTEHLVLAMAQDQRFGEIMSVAEGLDSDGVKKAIKKSRVLYNRCAKRWRWRWWWCCWGGAGGGAVQQVRLVWEVEVVVVAVVAGVVVLVLVVLAVVGRGEMAR